MFESGTGCGQLIGTRSDTIASIGKVMISKQEKK